MPNDLMSREAVMAAVGKMKAIGGLARIAVKSVIAEVPAALPAAGDERWEKLRTWLSGWHERMEKIADNPNDSAHYESGYAAHALGSVLSHMDYLSPPTQEAGDDEQP